MDVQELAINLLDVSQFNTRKNLKDGQEDSTVAELAKSIQAQGLLNPILVVPKGNGRYDVVAGQRRLLAFKHLGRSTIPATIRQGLKDADARTLSLVENVHRADMNPLDKATAFKGLLDTLGTSKKVSEQTGVTPATIRKYVRLLSLGEDLQRELAAGEAKNTEALAMLAGKIPDPAMQGKVWNEISGFTQDVQLQIIRRLKPDLSNLNELVENAAEGSFNFTLVRNCPFDCPTIPAPLKEKVAAMVKEFQQ